MLELTGLIYSNSQAVFTSVAMSMLRGDSFRLMAGNRAVHQQLEVVPWPHLNLAQAAENFIETRDFVTPDVWYRLW